jgi:hypothetical protein
MVMYWYMYLTMYRALIVGRLDLIGHEFRRRTGEGHVNEILRFRFGEAVGGAGRAILLPLFL